MLDGPLHLAVDRGAGLQVRLSVPRQHRAHSGCQRNPLGAPKRTFMQVCLVT